MGLVGERFLEQVLRWGKRGLGKERRPEGRILLVDKCNNAAEERRVSHCLQRNGFSKCVTAMQIDSALLSAELLTIIITIFPKLTDSI